MAEDKTIRLTSDQLMQQYRVERSKLSELTRRRNQLIATVFETDMALKAAESIEKADKNESILVPLGAGLYIDAAVKNNSTLKYTMAGNIALDLTFKKAMEKIGKRKDVLSKELDAVKEERKRTGKNVRTMENIFAQMQQQQKPKQ